jgi:hypothetical protein
MRQATRGRVRWSRLLALEQTTCDERFEGLGGVLSTVQTHSVLSLGCDWSQVFGAPRVTAGNTCHRKPTFVATRVRAATRSFCDGSGGFDGAGLLQWNVVNVHSATFVGEINLPPPQVIVTLGN